MRAAHSRESRLLESLYRAAGSPSLWPSTLVEWAKVFRADFCLLAAEDFSSAGPPLLHGTHPPDDPLWRAYLERHRRNPFTATSVRLPAGTVRRADEAFPREVLLDSGFYREVLEPLGVLNALGANLINEPGAFAYLGLLRSPRAGPFADRQLVLLSSLCGHLAQAVRLQLRLQGVDLERAAALDALDHVARGVILVGQGGALCFANAEASQLLGEGDALSTDHGRLRATVREDDDRLQRLLGQAIGHEVARRAGGTMAVRRASGGPAVTLEVLPLGEDAAGLVCRAPRAAVYLSDPSGDAAVSGRLLAQAFGLTPREADVCALLVAGRELRSIARELGVSVTTVRTHLLHAFDKTGTRRQADLIKKLLAAAPATRKR